MEIVVGTLRHKLARVPSKSLVVVEAQQPLKAMLGEQKISLGCYHANGWDRGDVAKEFRLFFGLSKEDKGATVAQLRDATAEPESEFPVVPVVRCPELKALLGEQQLMIEGFMESFSLSAESDHGFKLYLNIAHA